MYSIILLTLSIPLWYYVSSCLAFNLMNCLNSPLIKTRVRKNYAFYIPPTNQQSASASTTLFTLNEEDKGENETKDENENIDDLPIIAQSTVKIDDGGSDLTDRFKYKVNALMGKYDPIQGPETDNETTDGNILQAMLKFPTMYSFNIVGRTCGDGVVAEGYINDVRHIVLEVTGDKDLQLQSVPRGKNFIKITIEAVVESASMINLIYAQLAEHELTKMSF